MDKLKVLIIGGTGDFGCFYAELFKEEGFEVAISSRNEKEGKKFCKKHGFEFSTDPSVFDVVILSVPNKAAPELAAEVLVSMKPNALFVDFCSVKTRIVPVLENFKGKGLELASLHPMHGPRIGSISGYPVALIEIEPGEKLKTIKKFFTNRGANIIQTTAKEHDEILATVQGLTHYSQFVSAAVLREMKTDIKKTKEFSSPNYSLFLSLLSRVVLQNPELYCQIQTENPYNEKMREVFSKSAQNLERICKDKTCNELEKEIILDAQEFEDPEEMLLASDVAVSALKNVSGSRKIKLHKGEKDAILAAEKMRGENKLTGYLGPEASFSHEAALGISSQKNLMAYSSIPSVFRALKKDEIEQAIVPIENSTGGSVSVTLDELIENDFFIIGEKFLKIKQCLLSKSELSEIKKIYSHPQGFMQCKDWLENNANGAELVEVQSTSKAAEIASEEEGAGAIASQTASEMFGLNILEEEINDKGSNETRFVVVSNKEASPEGARKTSVIIGVKNEVGALYRILRAFEKGSINMTKLESRPSRKVDWEYLFFIDFEGNLSEERVKNALWEIESNSTIVKPLGSYSRV